MAALISKATGNFTAAATWGLTAATTNAYLVTNTGFTSTTTSVVYSSNFTLGTSDGSVEGIALCCRRLNTTGTVTISLNNGTSDMFTVTANASDLPSQYSWVFFKAASPWTIVQANTYRIGIIASSAANATFSYVTTTPNWSRIVRLASTQAPVNTNTLYVLGNGHTSGDAVTVTMDSTSGTNGYNGLTIGHNGTVTYGTTASTTYILKLSGALGSLDVWGNGTLNMGTSGTRMPATSFANLILDCPTANGTTAFNIRDGGTLNAYGAVRAFDRTKLSANVSAGGTSLTVQDDVSSGAVPWGTSGYSDQIVLASTSRTYSDSEVVSVSATSSYQITLSSGTGAAHSGTSPANAEIGLLTRNVKITGAPVYPTAPTYTPSFNIWASASVVLDWVQVNYFGLNNTTTTYPYVAGRRGITLATSTNGTCTINRCAIHNIRYWGIYHGGSYLNVYITDNIFYLLNELGNSALHGINFAGSIAGASNLVTITGNLSLRTNGAAGALINQLAFSFDNNTFVGFVQYGVIITNIQITDTIDNLIIHSGGGGTYYGLYLNFSYSPEYSITFSGIKIWRLAGYGIGWSQTGVSTGITFYNGVFFGNNVASVYIVDDVYNIIFDSCAFNGDTTFATSSGLYISSSVVAIGIKLLNCIFGAASGILTTHSTQDIYPGMTYEIVQMYLENCELYSSIAVYPDAPTAWTTNRFESFVKATKLTVAGPTTITGKTFTRAGYVQSNTSVYRTYSPSEQLHPVSSTIRIVSGSKLAVVNSGQAIIPKVWVRRTTAGATAIRLMHKRNDAMGISADTVLDSITPSINTWTQLNSGGSPTPNAPQDGVYEFYVDSDNTNGDVYVDDWEFA